MNGSLYAPEGPLISSSLKIYQPAKGKVGKDKNNKYHTPGAKC